MLKVVEGTPEHLLQLVPRPEFKSTLEDRERVIRRFYATGGMAVINDCAKPVAFFGANFIYPKVVQIWAVVSEDVKLTPIAFHRTVQRLLESFTQTHGLARVQITVRADFLAAKKWALALGFKYEGKLKKYGPDGSDYFIYARVK